MTRAEWEEEWHRVFTEHSLKHGNLGEALRFTNTWMREHHGAPPAEDARPPLWLHIVASLSGVSWDMITKIWALLNGKKTISGLILTILTAIQVLLITLVPAVATAFPNSKVLAWVTGVAATVTTIVGLGHKLYKFLYHEDHN